MAETLAAILPRGAVAVERGAIRESGSPRADAADAHLHPVEEKLIAGASEGRRREFAEARACAREALAALGVAAGPIPSTPDGAPVWPEGVVGSITHKGGYRAAAVARASTVASLGVDAEADVRLPDGLLETIASPSELDQVEALLAGQPGLAWDRLLFCAKEAVVKAVHPLGLPPAGVREVEIAIDHGEGAFEAVAPPAGVRAIEGSWAARDGLLLTAAWAE